MIGKILAVHFEYVVEKWNLENEQQEVYKSQHKDALFVAVKHFEDLDELPL